MSTRTLASVGFDIDHIFHYLESATTESPLHGALFEQKERFELWATNIGLYQHGHASLDYRFRDAPDIYHYCQSLLEDLQKTLKLVKSELLNETGDASNRSEQDEIGEDDTISDVENSLDGYDDETTAEAAISSAVDCIDRLFRLSMKVRNPATRTGISKGYSFTRVDEETHVDLFDRFSDLRIDHLHVEHILQTHRPNQERADLQSTFLNARLARANNLRRRQFAYWSQHKINLVRRAEKEKALKQWQRDLILQSQHPPSLTERSKPTTATQVDRANVNLDDDAQSAISTMSMNIPEITSSSGDVLVFPDPPAKYMSLKELKEFECPYCFTLCSRRLLNLREWRAHILKDLRPYVCTYEKCQSGSQLYDSFGDWMNHEFSQHCRRSTSGSVTATDLKENRECPFCFENFTSWETAMHHIATHLIRVALFALPRSTGVEIEQDDRSAISNEKARNSGLSGSEPSLGISEASFGSLPFEQFSPREKPSTSIRIKDGEYTDGRWTCSCGLEPVLRVSAQPHSPGRKFLRCPKSALGQCKFFVWESDVPSLKRTQSLPKLKDPKREERYSIEPDMCPVCRQTFSERRTLDEHCSNVHHSCSMCGLTFENKSELEYHVDSHLTQHNDSVTDTYIEGVSDPARQQNIDQDQPARSSDIQEGDTEARWSNQQYRPTLSSDVLGERGGVDPPKVSSWLDRLGDHLEEHTKSVVASESARTASVTVDTGNDEFHGPAYPDRATPGSGLRGRRDSAEISSNEHPQLEDNLAKLAVLGSSKVQSTDQVVEVSTESDARNFTGSEASDAGLLKSMRVSLEDPCFKVLPKALEKYNINADWRQYSLYIVYENSERQVGLQERPLAMFKELDKKGKKPTFMLRKQVAPESTTPEPTSPKQINLDPNSSVPANPEPPSVEIFKSFRVGLHDPCWKVLPAALKRYNIDADWRQYALYIVYGDLERCLGLEEKPLLLFKQLDKEGKKPMFMLRKMAAPVSEAGSRELPMQGLSEVKNIVEEISTVGSSGSLVSKGPVADCGETLSHEADLRAHAEDRAVADTLKRQMPRKPKGPDDQHEEEEGDEESHEADNDDPNAHGDYNGEESNDEGYQASDERPPRRHAARPPKSTEPGADVREKSEGASRRQSLHKLNFTPSQPAGVQQILPELGIDPSESAGTKQRGDARTRANEMDPRIGMSLDPEALDRDEGWLSPDLDKVQQEVEGRSQDEPVSAPRNTDLTSFSHGEGFAISRLGKNMQTSQKTQQKEPDHFPDVQAMEGEQSLSRDPDYDDYDDYGEEDDSDNDILFNAKGPPEYDRRFILPHRFPGRRHGSLSSRSEPSEERILINPDHDETLDRLEAETRRARRSASRERRLRREAQLRAHRAEAEAAIERDRRREAERRY